jgi:hypothetical protein
MSAYRSVSPNRTMRNSETHKTFPVTTLNRNPERSAERHTLAQVCQGVFMGGFFASASFALRASRFRFDSAGPTK